MDNLAVTLATALFAAVTTCNSAAVAQTQAALAAGSCAPINGLNFICGVENPEDLVSIPGTRWLIASGLKEGAGLKLIDTDAKRARIFYTGELTQQRPDMKLFPNCPASPDAKTFNTHGIYLRPAQAPGVYRLYVVSHGSLESIQVFAVDVNGSEPSLAWMGCVPMPDGSKAYPGADKQGISTRLVANAVAAFSDGTIIATIPMRPGTTNRQRLGGEPTGDVVEWKPGEESFQVIPGTQLSGNNGIEISPDETEFYVVSFGTHTVVVFSRKGPANKLRQTLAPGFMPDNLRWSGHRLIAAGPMYDEPACGGTRLAVIDNAVLSSCHRGYVVAQLDPNTMAWTILAYAEPNPELNVVATGVVIGDTLWIGAASADGVAYRHLPHPSNTAR